MEDHVIVYAVVSDSYVYNEEESNAAFIYGVYTTKEAAEQRKSEESPWSDIHILEIPLNTSILENL